MCVDNEERFEPCYQSTCLPSLPALRNNLDGGYSAFSANIPRLGMFDLLFDIEYLLRRDIPAISSYFVPTLHRLQDGLHKLISAHELQRLATIRVRFPLCLSSWRNTYLKEAIQIDKGLLVLVHEVVRLDVLVK